VESLRSWTLPLAEELGVPHVTFSPASVHYLATSHSLWRRMPTRPDDADDTKRELAENRELAL
jgi:hypothetical protein